MSLSKPVNAVHFRCADTECRAKMRAYIDPSAKTFRSACVRCDHALEVVPVLFKIVPPSEVLIQRHGKEVQRVCTHALVGKADDMRYMRALFRVKDPTAFVPGFPHLCKIAAKARTWTNKAQELFSILAKDLLDLNDEDDLRRFADLGVVYDLVTLVRDALVTCSLLFHNDGDAEAALKLLNPMIDQLRGGIGSSFTATEIRARAEVYALRAHVHLHTEKYYEAYNDAERALAVDENHKIALMVHAHALMHFANNDLQDDTDAALDRQLLAVKDLERAATAAPTDASLLTKLARAREDAHKTKGIIKKKSAYKKKNDARNQLGNFTCKHCNHLWITTKGRFETYQSQCVRGKRLCVQVRPRADIVD